MFSILVRCYYRILQRRDDVGNTNGARSMTSPRKAARLRKSAKRLSALLRKTHLQLPTPAKARTAGVEEGTISVMTTTSALPASAPLTAPVDNNTAQKPPANMSSRRTLDEIAEVGRPHARITHAPKLDGDSIGPATPIPTRLSRTSVSGISSSRPAPPSPAPSRQSSLCTGTHSRSRPVSTSFSVASSTVQSRREGSPPADNIAPTGRQKKTKSRRSASLIIRVRDYAFPPSDERHLGALTLSSPRNSVSSYASRFSGFASRFGFIFGDRRANRRDESPLRASTPTQDEDGTADYGYEEGNETGADGQNAIGQDPILVPGIYRAMYDFEPQGAHEMALQEDQLVYALGNSGGDGWAVVLAEDSDERFLVPAVYLEWYAEPAAVRGLGTNSGSTQR
ncbi:uncharacterized protein EI90DRAFT_3072372 [Cantharellus anzutake]|uniref:uncharacterized protein n=1 Tax=Cantharellus anzutake TaxID=1750568 RepID=UPI0019088BE0|nr:uncharacterized protein EI90DRAFT_3072372 [Cantharellus anzutake]KAF8325647.1 hypothetical protein EI90DRAFT_3072372 [Cantharellus anzutake]